MFLQFAFRVSEKYEQNRLHYFEEVKFFLCEQMSCRKNEREDELDLRMCFASFHTLYFSTEILLLI